MTAHTDRMKGAPHSTRGAGKHDAQCTHHDDVILHRCVHGAPLVPKARRPRSCSHASHSSSSSSMRCSKRGADHGWGVRFIGVGYAAHLTGSVATAGHCHEAGTQYKHTERKHRHPATHVHARLSPNPMKFSATWGAARPYSPTTCNEQRPLGSQWSC